MRNLPKTPKSLHVLIIAYKTTFAYLGTNIDPLLKLAVPSLIALFMAGLNPLFANEFLHESEFLGIPPYELPYVHHQGLSDGFIAPNERNPAISHSMLKNIPQGAYVSVGSERGFMAAAALEQINFLLLVDLNRDTILFNRINTVLLRVSNSRSDYLKLRLSTSQKNWLDRAKDASVRSYDLSVLTDPNIWQFWRETILLLGFRDFHQKPWFWKRDFPFKDANYLHNDALFKKIQRLAKSNRIESHQVNINDLSAIESILSRLKAKNITVSVWDESNVNEYRRHASSTTLDHVAKTVLPFTSPTSVFLMTEDFRGFNVYWSNRWEYHANTFAYLSENTFRPYRKYLIDTDTPNTCKMYFYFSK